MKISIGAKIKQSPWGGGNKFAINLADYLKSRGWVVVTDLADKDIDIILMTEPRRYSASSTYNQLKISEYVIKHPGTVVIHRINNCDEGRNTRKLNKYLTRANKVADSTIFISNYLKNIYIGKGLIKNKNFRVIKNGADDNLFKRDGRIRWDKKGILKIVTHHWSSNYNKGFDIYKELDKLAQTAIDGIKISFNYIGNIPDDFNFENTKVISPLDKGKLVNEIKKNHIYVTGAKGEGAGMHHIEAALCGLPLLYRNSGALPEYCKGFGVMFNGVYDLREKLIKIIKEYDFLFDKMEQYPYNSRNMCENYENFILEMLNSIKFGSLLKRRLKFLFIYFKEIILSIKDIIWFKLKRY